MVDGAESWVVTSQRDDSEYGVVVDPGVEHPPGVGCSSAGITCFINRDASGGVICHLE